MTEMVKHIMTTMMATRRGNVKREIVVAAGGVLVGVSFFVVIAETQLRFVGGLSDVVWLVEEGLRDVNSESSRWSFPILLGARIRF